MTRKIGLDFDSDLHSRPAKSPALSVMRVIPAFFLLTRAQSQLSPTDVEISHNSFELCAYYYWTCRFSLVHLSAFKCK